MELWNRRKTRAAVTQAETPSEVHVVSPAIMGEADAISFGTAQILENGADVVMSPSSGGPARARIKERSFQAKLEWRLDDDEFDPASNHDNSRESVAQEASPEGPAGVLKWRCDQRMRMGLLYEGRYKSLLFSLGTDINLKKLDAPFRTVGLAIQFSS